MERGPVVLEDYLLGNVGAYLRRLIYHVDRVDELWILVQKRPQETQLILQKGRMSDET